MRHLRHVSQGLTLVTAFTLLAACSGDGMGPNNGGNGGTPTFSADVQPILSDRCALSGCHIGANAPPDPSSPMDLSSGQAYQNTVNVQSFQVPSLMRISPGNPDQSYLVHKIQGTQGSVGGTGTQMPQTNCCLSQTQINTIRSWISAGAMNN